MELIIKSKVLRSYSSGLLLNHIPPILYLWGWFQGQSFLTFIYINVTLLLTSANCLILKKISEILGYRDKRHNFCSPGTESGGNDQ